MSWLVAEHVEVRGTTMEPDPFSPGNMRQTAYCRFCAAHRPDEDWRWPCEAAGLLAEIARLRKIEEAARDVVLQQGRGNRLMATTSRIALDRLDASLDPLDEP